MATQSRIHLLPDKPLSNDLRVRKAGIPGQIFTSEQHKPIPAGLKLALIHSLRCLLVYVAAKGSNQLNQQIRPTVHLPIFYEVL